MNTIQKASQESQRKTALQLIVLSVVIIYMITFFFFNVQEVVAFVMMRGMIIFSLFAGYLFVCLIQIFIERGKRFGLYTALDNNKLQFPLPVIIGHCVASIVFILAALAIAAVGIPQSISEPEDIKVFYVVNLILFWSGYLYQLIKLLYSTLKDTEAF